jgi:hypothetical protein
LSQYRYSAKDNEITVPFPAEDLLQSFRGGVLELRTKQDIPSIGFTGWADISALKRAKIFIKELPITLGALFDEKRGAEHKGLLFRKRALAALSNTKGIEPHFTARATYSGHVATISGTIAHGVGCNLLSDAVSVASHCVVSCIEDLASAVPVDRS